MESQTHQSATPPERSRARQQAKTNQSATPPTQNRARQQAETRRHRPGRAPLTQGDHYPHARQRKPTRRVAERARPQNRGTAFRLWAGSSQSPPPQNRTRQQADTNRAATARERTPASSPFIHTQSPNRTTETSSEFNPTFDTTSL
jgi:hypothetical protein